MAERFCRYCGQPLEEGVVHNCPNQPRSDSNPSTDPYQSTENTYQGSQRGTRNSYQNTSGNGGNSAWNTDNIQNARERMKDVGNVASDVAGRTAQWAKQGVDWFSDKVQEEEQARTSSGGVYERNTLIVDECIVPTEEEIPVRQYDIAILRTIFPYKRAEGRLQVTNKRVIFRATGKSWLGPHFLENEFSLSEIGGIELKQDHRVNFWFLIPAILLLFVSGYLSGALATLIYQLPSFFLGLYSFAALLGCAALTYFLKKYFWVKMCAWTVPTTGFSMLYRKSLMSYYYNGGGVSEFLSKIWTFLLIICAIAVAVFAILYLIKEDLIIKIKVNGANNVMEIRRQQAGFCFWKPEEYTGFAEVLPWRDAEIATRELGALINDVKLYGDAGIRKWQ